MEECNKPRPTETADKPRLPSIPKSYVWAMWVLAIIAGLALGLWKAPSWMAFWGRCIGKSWSLAYGLFALVELVCGLLAACLLAHKSLASKLPKEWEDLAMKTAWLILFGAFLISTVFVAPFLESSELTSKLSVSAERLRKIEAEGPHLYKKHIKFSNDGVIQDEKLIIEYSLINQSECPAVDPEILSVLATETASGFTVLATSNSAYAEIAPRYSVYGRLEIGIILGGKQFPGKTQDLVLLILARYAHPITGTVLFHQPIIELSQWDKSAQRAGAFGAIPLSERSRFLQLFEKEYRKFMEHPRGE